MLAAVTIPRTGTPVRGTWPCGPFLGMVSAVKKGAGRMSVLHLSLGLALLLGSGLCLACGARDHSQRIAIRGAPLAKYNACREIHRDSPEDIDKLCTPYLNEG